MSIERLSGGLTPADGSDPRTFPEIFNGFADEFEDKNLPGFSAVVPTDGQVPVFDAVEGVFVPGEGGGLPSNAFAFVGTVTFESNGTFSKGDFPFLRAIRVKVQGAGGGGGSVDALDDIGEAAAGGGGAGGAFAESFITDIAGLAGSVTVNVGQGGAGGAAAGASGDGESGFEGGQSAFGSVIANGGFGGGRGFESTSVITNIGGAGPLSGSGDLFFSGSAGGSSYSNGSAVGAIPNAIGGTGGDAFLGGGGQGPRAAGPNVNNTFAGNNGGNYGGGGSGSCGNSPTETLSGLAGGDGAPGIVLVELFA